MKKTLPLIVFILFSAISAGAQNAVSLATRFIGLLTDSQKENTVFPFDNEERYNYHFVPLQRKGVTFNEMTDQQKQVALDLMKSCMSEESFKKINQIRQLEYVLIDLEKRQPDDHYRDQGNYHFSIFGTPGPKNIWGWRFEGHHVSFNFSFDKQTLTSGAPAFLGSNPGIVTSGPQKGTQVLKDETDMGFAMLHSLSAAQLQKTVIDTAAFKDILTFDKRKAMIENPAGIRYSELNSQQQATLLQLIGVYVHRFTKLFADDMLADIRKSGLDNVRFAWAGNTAQEPGKGTYYRVQGPTIIIEYDNTQNNANHVHSVLRDLKHDFGGDELLEHYKTAHSQQ